MRDSKQAETSSSPSPDLSRLADTLRTAYRSWILHSPDDGPSSLLSLLVERLPHIPPDSWPARLDFGGVYVNGHAALADRQLPFPCKVEYYEPKFSIADAAQVFPPFDPGFILHADGMIAVAYKPAGLSSMPAKEQRHFSLKAYLDRHFGTSVHMPSRLDVSAQGLVIVSTNPRAHSALQQAFESRLAHKTYFLATVAPMPWEQRSVSLPIGRDDRHPVLRTVHAAEGQSALTHFRRSHSADSAGQAVTVVRAEPVSGRTHQIRVHAASQGIPILGDNFYGGAVAGYLHLVSFSIAVPHPLTGQPLEISLPQSLRPDWLADSLFSPQPR